MRPSDDQVEAGHGADLRFDRLAQGVAVEQARRCPDRPISATPKIAATGIPRRFIPWAIVNDISEVWLNALPKSVSDARVRQRCLQLDWFS